MAARRQFVPERPVPVQDGIVLAVGRDNVEFRAQAESLVNFCCSNRRGAEAVVKADGEKSCRVRHCRALSFV